MQENLSLVLQFATLLGIVFGVFLYFRKPQEDIETKQAVTDKEMAGKATQLAQKELETKALVLAEQVKAKNEENERRFCDIGLRLDAAMTTAQNHIHSISVQVDDLSKSINSMNLNIMKLQTIIEERLPVKK